MVPISEHPSITTQDVLIFPYTIGWKSGVTMGDNRNHARKNDREQQIIHNPIPQFSTLIEVG
jgi:hypothetical protein